MNEILSRLNAVELNFGLMTLVFDTTTNASTITGVPRKEN
jgi:hypothetical protein